jgi:hypothetical protein
MKFILPCFEPFSNRLKTRKKMKAKEFKLKNKKGKPNWANRADQIGPAKKQPEPSLSAFLFSPPTSGAHLAGRLPPTVGSSTRAHTPTRSHPLKASNPVFFPSQHTQNQSTRLLEFLAEVHHRR